MIFDIILIILSFILLWLGAGMSINGVEKLSKRLKISSFVVSFFVLGILTSLSEISVAYFSLANKVPEMSAGNLIGASVVLTLFIIPLYAILNNGVKIDDRYGPINYDVAYFTIALPALLLLDKKIDFFDLLVIICALIIFSYTLKHKSRLLEKIEHAIIIDRTDVVKELLKIIFGTVLILLSSKFLVDMGLEYSQKLGTSTFLIGLFMLSIGTNLPEISILVKAFLRKEKNIALGDFIGSGIINCVILIVLAFFNHREIIINNGLKYNVFMLPLGALLFLFFSRNRKLERDEGIILIVMYIIFVVGEFMNFEFLII
ncbi:hypothetical protein A2V49_00695 [candidate division WWE3 bacterium RBG_19FT_COMBO_34_6]|uniref:Sodium/calcium exchanger membrane region domain-containing protein n=1 Tax=candidate division WWE3 bacterium RBG_19FT_COMBO_34_6 TaxID=1802612 RepID=A0A1F4UKH7_UNCKA|nr:MAG: hypothetical protein A2V49_00695 [candidate division WWE3 bacterium RBG_19FT_COMBO_34_6]